MASIYFERLYWDKEFVGLRKETLILVIVNSKQSQEQILMHRLPIEYSIVQVDQKHL